MKKSKGNTLIVCLIAFVIFFTIASCNTIPENELSKESPAPIETAIATTTAEAPNITDTTTLTPDVHTDAVETFTSTTPATHTPATTTALATVTVQSTEKAIPLETATLKPTAQPTPTAKTHAHKYTNKVTKATCTADGYTTYTCACGDTYTGNKTSALSHSYGAWKTVKEATTSAEGKRERVCSRCSKKESKSIPKLTPTSKYDIPAVKGTESLVEERIIYYINKYRVEEGNKAATALSDIYFEYAGIRSEQIISNFAHDRDDIRKAAMELEFGIYRPEEEETMWDPVNQQVIYTGNMIPAHYEPYGREAIGGGFGSTVDELAKDLVDRCRASSDHWSYVGAASEGNKVYNYIAVGITFPYDCYEAWVCIVMDETDYYK